MRVTLAETGHARTSSARNARWRRVVWVGFWVVVFGIAVTLEALPFVRISSEFWPEPLVFQRDVAQRWSFILGGVLMWRLRPNNRTWRLLLAAGFVGLFAILGHVPVPAAQTISIALGPLHYAVILYLILAYPRGMLSGLADRVVVGLAYAYVVIFGVLLALGLDPTAAYGCAPSYCRNPAYLIRSPVFISNVSIAAEFSAATILLVFLLLVGRRLVRSPPPIRPLLAPMLVAALLFAASMGIQFGPLVRLTHPSQGAVVAFDWAVTVTLILIPIAFLVGLLQMRLTQAAMGRFVLELEATPRQQLRDSLARLLHDPSVDLAFWSRQLGRYVDAQGRTVDPRATAGERAVTMVERGGEPIAAVRHEASLRVEPGLLDAATAALGWTLENERLQAELRAQLEETRASRARIVEAGDTERRRVERNLHDGAQQRLVTLSLMLRRARSQIGEDMKLGSTLGKAVEELGTAIDELRDLAQGIHPSILSEEGLGPALESLLERAAAPATLTAAPTNRLPYAVEATAYFVVAEALTNVVKYAQASAVTISATQGTGGLVVEVVDDGVGGAQVSKGSGLRGLSDRAAAVGGRLTIESPPGEGTRIVAELPCE